MIYLQMACNFLIEDILHLYVFTKYFNLIESICKFCGAGKRSRTPDLMITNQLLYQLSYAGVGCDYAIVVRARQNPSCLSAPDLSWRDQRNQTRRRR